MSCNNCRRDFNRRFRHICKGRKRWKPSKRWAIKFLPESSYPTGQFLSWTDIGLIGVSYVSPQSNIQQFGMKWLESIIIKQQHNVKSNSMRYYTHTFSSLRKKAEVKMFHFHTLMLGVWLFYFTINAIALK